LEVYGLQRYFVVPKCINNKNTARNFQNCKNCFALGS